jgi:hypothetical protein
VWTEQDDEEIEYGEWKELTAKETLAEERKVHPAKAIEGIPSGYLRQKRESDDKTGKNERNHPVDNEVSTHLARLIYHRRPTIWDEPGPVHRALFIF